MQTLIDLSIQHYGNPEAVAVLIADNPGLFPNDREFELTADVPNAETLTVRDEDVVKDKKVLKEFDGKIVVS
jgi:hypothetical protein